MSLRTKIILIAIIVLTISSVTMIFLTMELNITKATLQEINRSKINRLIIKHKLENELNDISTVMLAYIESPGKNLINELTKNILNYKNTLEEYEKFFPEERKTLIQELNLLSERYINDIYSYLELEKNVPPPNIIQRNLISKKEKILDILNREVSLSPERIKDIIENNALKHILRMRVLILVSAFLFIGVSIFILLFDKNVMRKILMISNGVKAYSRGDLSYRIKKVSIEEDELDIITDCLNKMAEKRQKIEKNLCESINRERNIRKTLEQELNRSLLLKEIIYASLRKWDAKSVFRSVLKTLEKRGWIDYGLFSFYKKNEGKIELTTFSSPAQQIAKQLGLFEGQEINIGESSALKDWIEGRRKTISIDFLSLSESAFPLKKKLIERGLSGVLGIPLLVEDKLFGFLFVGRKKRIGFSEEERDFLHSLCDYLTLTLQNIETYYELLKAYEELREARALMNQQERLLALGKMASGITHDISNALSPIIGFSDLLLAQKKGLSKNLRKYVLHIKAAAEDIVTTIRRLRDFYRKRSEKEIPVRVNLNEMVKQIIKLNQPLWKDEAQKQGKTYEIIKRLDESLPEILLDENGLRSALNNLFINSLEAMPDGGKFTIVTGRDKELEWIEISDTGIGMDEETVKRCIEPFYSTKGESGTGLGLSQVYGFVKRYNGNIDIESKPGVGAKIRLSFPIQKELKEPSDKEKQKIIQEPRGLTILTIDDDEMLRLLLKEMLQSLGHNVIVGEGGEHGLKIYKEFLGEGKKIDIVITDLGMPGIDGKKVAIEVKKLTPHIPVILLTGWGERFTKEEGIPEVIDEILSKPPRLREIRFTIAKLAKEIKG